MSSSHHTLGHDHDGESHKGHDHGHAGHAHSHSHAPADFGRAFAIGITLNTLFIVAEVIFGLRANSLALVADAGHNASDVLGLALAWGATWLAKRSPTQKYTYGLQSSSILAAFGNAMMLLVVTGGICWEALQRFYAPEGVAGKTVIVVAAIGTAVNGLSALLFMRGSKTDLNIRGAFLHLMGDAAIAVGVVVSGILILKTGWHWIDPAVSIAVSLAVIYSTWGLFKDSMSLTLHAVPAHIDYKQVRHFLAAGEGVKDVHDLHIWAISTSETALSAHLLMPGGHPGDRALGAITAGLHDRFGIEHATLQIELGDSQLECPLASEHVV
jgi:cobalt-zinc-cadmium efflux system protein